MPTVSVIVPVYNDKDLLPRCIESILSQTFKDIELILIDDCSSDNCLEICHKYSSLDNRVHVISKEHSGVSSTRNRGLDNMSGTYVCFCDADDEFPKDAVSSLIQAQKTSNADLVIGGFNYYNIKTETVKPYSSSRTDFIINEYELKNKAGLLWQENNMLTSCAKLYNADIIRANKIRFNENLTVLEDFDFVLSYLKCIDTIHNIEQYTYHQVVGYTGDFRRPWVDYMDDVNYVYDKFMQYLKIKSIPISDKITNEIDAQTVFVLEIIFDIPPNGFKDYMKRKKRAKKILSFCCVKKALRILFSKTKYKLLNDKYGIIKLLSGIAVKLKEIDDDYSVIKVSKGAFFATLWKWKERVMVYL